MNNSNTSIGKIERMINRFKQDSPLINDWEEYEISFEFICASLFPKIWDNIQKTMRDYYTKGYIEGLKEGKENESKRIN